MLSTQDLVKVREIRDDHFILSDGKVVSLLEVSGALFSVISPDERETMIAQFQAFLNALEFPVQIIVASRLTNFNKYFAFLREQLKTLQEQHQQLLSEHLEDYLNFINGFLSLNRVLDKRFFLVVSYQNPASVAKSAVGGDFLSKLLPLPAKKPQPQQPAAPPSLESSQDTNQLQLREDTVGNNLRTMGLDVAKLTGSDLVAALYQLFNPELTWKDQSEIPSLQQRENPQTLLAPTLLSNEADFIKVNNLTAKGFATLAYPEYLNVGWLIDVIESDMVYTLSVFYSPLPTEEIMKYLQRQTARVESDISWRLEHGLVRDPKLEEAYKNVEGLRDVLTQGQEKMFDVGMYLTLFAESKPELDGFANRVKAIFSTKLVDVKPLMFQQLETFQNCLPYNQDLVNLSSQLNTGPASTFLPFLTATISGNYGVLYGVNLLNNSLVIIDRFSYENPHLIIFAQSGAGKSYFTKLEVMRSLYLGLDTIVLDPEDEYAPTAQYLGGSFLPISLSSEYRINPFDLPEPTEGESLSDAMKEKASFLISFFRIILGSISPDELSILDKSIHLTYQSFNITGESVFADIKAFPTLNDFEMVLRSVVGGEEIAQKFYPYTKGSFAGLINKPSNISVAKQLVVFGLKNLQQDLKPVMMSLIIDYVYTKIRQEVKKRTLIIDESWLMMKMESGAEFLLNVVKRGRKYRLGVTIINQDVEDFLLSQYGKPIINNSALIFLLRQSPAAIDLLTQVFKLTPSEKDILLRAEVGEGIFFAGLKHVPMKVIASYTEDQIITNSPLEQLKIADFKAAPNQ